MRGREEAGRDWPTRLLRLALRLYPQRFRRAYADEMLEVWSELRRERRTRHGRPGVAWLWTRTVANVVSSALAERLEAPAGPRKGDRGMDSLVQDVRYGLRMMLRSPGLTAVAVLLLAVGIGASSAVFGFVNVLFLERLALPDPERVVRVVATEPDSNFGPLAYPNYRDVRDRSASFEGLAAHRNLNVRLGEDQADELRAELVTGNYFATLGVGAALGRTLTPEDDRVPGAHFVAVLGHRAWKSRFGGAADVVGRNVRVGSHELTVIGVAPESFRGTYEAYDTALWLPLAMHAQVRPAGLNIEERGWGWLQATGRLRAGVTLGQARTELEAIALQLRQEHPRHNEDIGLTLLPAGRLPEANRGQALGVLGFFLLIVLLVLLVACANIGSVLLARVVARRRETAVRLALGATRGRLVRQWLIECLLLSSLGGAAGLVVALWTQGALAAMARSSDLLAAFSLPLGLDPRVLGFTLASSLLVGVLFGSLPALRVGRVEPNGVLKEEGRTGAGGLRRARSLGAFVVFQVAVWLVLLITAGLLLRTLRTAQAFDPGFRTENLLLTGVSLRAYGYTDEGSRQFLERLRERLQALPGVESVSSALVVPLGGDEIRQGYQIDGHVSAKGEPFVPIDTNVVGPGYFTTMGIALVRGRALDARPGDAETGVVVNETMARRFWPGREALGQRLRRGSDGPELEVIGIARDMKYYTLDEAPLPYVYLSEAVAPPRSSTLHVRTRVDPRLLLRDVRGAVAEIDPRVPVQRLETFEDLRQAALLPQRLLAPITGVFAALALVLSAFGLYGLLSYSVTQRTRELGIRMALGARRADVLGMVVRQGLRLALLGMALGLAAALAVTRHLDRLLFGVSATDPATFAGISALLLLVALLACLVPALRATRVEPMAALRHD
jgi:predicted permease